MSLSERITLLPGFRAGNYLMVFRTDQLIGQRVESEFAVQPHGGIQVRIAGRTWFAVEAGLLRVFTSPRLDDIRIRAALSWRFDAPPGLREALK